MLATPLTLVSQKTINWELQTMSCSYCGLLWCLNAGIPSCALEYKVTAAKWHSLPFLWHSQHLLKPFQNTISTSLSPLSNLLTCPPPKSSSISKEIWNRSISSEVYIFVSEKCWGRRNRFCWRGLHWEAARQRKRRRKTEDWLSQEQPMDFRGSLAVCLRPLFSPSILANQWQDVCWPRNALSKGDW